MKRVISLSIAILLSACAPSQPQPRADNAWALGTTRHQGGTSGQIVHKSAQFSQSAFIMQVGDGAWQALFTDDDDRVNALYGECVQKSGVAGCERLIKRDTGRLVVALGYDGRAMRWRALANHLEQGDGVPADILAQCHRAGLTDCHVVLTGFRR